MTTLPPVLAPWSAELSVLDTPLALAVGPMVRHLDQLISRRSPAPGAAGQPDGYGGLTRRGDLSRLLISEWALAAEAPLEFLRRAAMNELLYLEPQHLDTASQGRAVALVDTGPDQLGGGRLVQLAALIVLHRRAARSGTEFVIGVLGDEPGRWRTGSIEVLLRGWLAARTAEATTAAAVAAWTDGLDVADEAWILAGHRLASSMLGRRRLLTSRECAWGAGGATAVEVLLDGDRIELALPHGSAAVQALRGAAFRTHRAAGVPAPWMRFPCFPGAMPQLVARGDGSSELLAIRVPFDGGQPGRLRRHQFAGPVLTAATIGQRLVALVHVDGVVRVECRGKGLGQLDRCAVAPLAMDLDDAGIGAIADGPLTPMAYVSPGELIVCLGASWWRLAPDGARLDDLLYGLLPTRVPDAPRLAWWSGAKVLAPPASVPEGRTEVVLGPGRLTAWREDGDRWRIAPDGRSVTTGAGERVLALVEVDREPALLTTSSTGIILRLRGLRRERTLTRWSGGAVVLAVHPTMSLIAVQREDGRVEVADLTTDELVLTVRGTA